MSARLTCAAAGHFVDGLTAVQVRDRVDLDPDELIDPVARTGPRHVSQPAAALAKHARVTSPGVKGS